ncbi:MAG: rhodanese-like domain-containing protein [Polyangiales bacterium]
MLFNMFAKTSHDGREKVKNGALLLDVRTPEEFREGHVAGAKNIPVQELARRLNELGPKSQHIVLYCRSGGRSAAAAQLLKGQGYQVTDIGAMSNW